RGDLSSGDPRVLQGAALPVRRERDARHGRRAGHAPHGWPRASHPDHLHHHGHRHARHLGGAAALRLLEQGRDHLGRLRRTGAPSDPRGHRLCRGRSDGVLHGTAHLPHLLRRLAGGSSHPGARARVTRGDDDPPDDPRGAGGSRRIPPRHARGRAGDRRGARRARAARDVRRRHHARRRRARARLVLLHRASRAAGPRRERARGLLCPGPRQVPHRRAVRSCHLPSGPGHCRRRGVGDRRQGDRGHRQRRRHVRILDQRVVAARADRQCAALRALLPRGRPGARRLLPGRMTPIDVAVFAAHWQAALPGIAVVVTACAVMLVDLVLGGRGRGTLAGGGLLGPLVTMALTGSAWNDGGDPSGFQHMLRADRYGLFFTIVICVSAALTLLMSVDFVREWGIPVGDFTTLVLLSTAGMIFLVLANDLIVVFVALETMSVGVYVLTASLRGDMRSNEAAMKYFLLGAFASSFLLFGVAFFYGATASTRLDVIAEAIARRPLEPFVLMGMALVLVGFAFKVALIPFQAWTPDVYEGAPTVVTAFMAVAVKAA